ncbi:hypothetical protein [Ottowia thiooxydans]|uniref:hypothetical protein n=1 Tax=Ottowia thiooxydans TaxID=219182 RepID=UPI0004039DB8|nr:hypothetical protein [Ottowia thiooxydans]
MKAHIALMALALTAGSAMAKLPALSDEAKAKAAEAAAKTAWSDKIAGYQLCQSQDRVAASYLTQARAAGKTVQPVTTPPCADPGPFSYTPPEPKPIEASGAHSPPATAATPPSTGQPTAAPTGNKP